MPLSLFASGAPHCRELLPRRHQLDETSWIDLFTDAVGGADALFADLEAAMSWHRGRRLMYGTWYDEPRLTATDPQPGAVVPPVVDEIRAELTQHYGRSFEGLFCNFYRTGDDSVAWHADRIGRTELDPLVAIVSLGGPRTFAMRPFGGGVARRHGGDRARMGQSGCPRPGGCIDGGAVRSQPGIR